MALSRDRVAVVVNGNAKQVTKELVAQLDQIVREGDLYVSRSLDEGREIARTIVERGYPVVVTGGGDGTFTQMVTWVTKEADQRQQAWPRFAFLRLGTGNALAWVLGAGDQKGKGVVADLARLRTEAGTRKLRMIDVEGTLTVFAGLGIDSIALQHFVDAKEKLARSPLTRPLASGGPAYVISILGRTLPGFIVRPHPVVRIVNDGDPAIRIGQDGRPLGPEVQKGEPLYEGPSRMVAMSTIPYWGFGARIFPYAEERDDRFNLRIVDITSAQVVMGIRDIWKGTYKSDTVYDFLCQRIAIHFDEAIPLQIGGDPVGDRNDVTVSLAPRPVEVVDYFSPPAAV